MNISIQPPDEEVFLLWRAGGIEARNMVWAWAYVTLSKRAWAEARRRCRDDETADNLAADALNKAFKEVTYSPELSLEWQGEARLRGFLWWRTLNRLRDGLRKELRRKAISIFEPVGANSEGDQILILDVLADERAASPEDHAISKGYVGTLFEFLLWFEKECANAPMLRAVVTNIVQYLTVRLEKAVAGTGSEMSFSDMLEDFDPADFGADKTEMYDFLMKTLDINRNTLDQRLKRLHARIEELFESFVTESKIGSSLTKTE